MVELTCCICQVTQLPGLQKFFYRENCLRLERITNVKTKFREMMTFTTKDIFSQ